jgi:cob(I)alamin adenosyltransferase
MAVLATSLHFGSFRFGCLIIHRNQGLPVIIMLMNRYYSRTGDDGYTGVLGEGRLPKSHPRLEVIGTIDEASAALGLVRAVSQSPHTVELLLAIQRDLYTMMAEVAASPQNAPKFQIINADRVSWLEQQIDLLSTTIELPREFTVSGNSLTGAALDLARTIVRRAERRLAELLHQGEIENADLLCYINRLSSLCYVLEGTEDAAAGKGLTLAKK